MYNSAGQYSEPEDMKPIKGPRIGYIGFLTGERPEPAFLIAKPFQPATVSAVISQALFFERKAKPRERRATA